MAPPHDTSHLHWTSNDIDSLLAPETDGNDGTDRTGGGPGEDAPADPSHDDAPGDRIVPRARCRECADRPGVRGLCIACFLE